MTTRTKSMTAEELLEKPRDGFRYAGNVHGYIAMRPGSRPEQFVRENRLGRVYAAETGFKISSDPDTVRAPEVAFLSRGRLEAKGDVPGYWPGAPDLVAEVVSRSDAHTDVTEKALAWLEAGCRVVLAADPSQRTGTVYRSRDDTRVLSGRDAIDGADVVPGFRLPVAELFG